MWEKREGNRKLEVRKSVENNFTIILYTKIWRCCYIVFHAARVLQATDHCTSYTDKSLPLPGTVGCLFQVPTLTNQLCPFVEYIDGRVNSSGYWWLKTWKILTFAHFSLLLNSNGLYWSKIVIFEFLGTFLTGSIGYFVQSCFIFF